ncbi:LuxR C-terminal-related transcriptional regulator, partial [Nocardia vinacea]|uniref:LuxR C-terminal-related transcriptional regulator n=1 Tax=Nocardia vinacea TaxID=96468 RepID=UPI003433BCA5
MAEVAHHSGDHPANGASDELVNTLLGGRTEQELAAAAARTNWHWVLTYVIREAIYSGAVAPGTRLPSARTFADQLESVRKTTVTEAYQELAAEGYVIGEEGYGTTVADQSLWSSMPPPATILPMIPAKLLEKLGRTQDLEASAASTSWSATLISELRQAILSGALAAGELLPPESTLAEHMGLSPRQSVAKAYRQLIAEGLLVRYKGIGAAVAGQGEPSAGNPAAGQEHEYEHGDTVSERADNANPEQPQQTHGNGLIGRVLPPSVRTAEIIGNAHLPALSMRLCVDRALHDLGATHEPIPVDPDGAPQWSNRLVGDTIQIENFTAAAFADKDTVITIGIDAKPHIPVPDEEWRGSTRSEERRRIRDLNQSHAGVHWDQVVISAKDCVAKAFLPLTGRKKSPDQIDVTLNPDTGTFEARAVSGPAVDQDPGWTTVSGRFVVDEDNGIVLAAVAVTDPSQPSAPLDDNAHTPRPDQNRGPTRAPHLASTAGSPPVWQLPAGLASGVAEAAHEPQAERKLTAPQDNSTSETVADADLLQHVLPAEVQTAEIVGDEHSSTLNLWRCIEEALRGVGRADEPIPIGPNGEPQLPNDLIMATAQTTEYTGVAVADGRSIRAIGLDAKPHIAVRSARMRNMTLPQERSHIRDLTNAHPTVHWDQVSACVKDNVLDLHTRLTGLPLRHNQIEVTLHPDADSETGTFEVRLPGGDPAVSDPSLTALSGRFRIHDGTVITGITLRHPNDDTSAAQSEHAPQGSARDDVSVDGRGRIEDTTGDAEQTPDSGHRTDRAQPTTSGATPWQRGRSASATGSSRAEHDNDDSGTAAPRPETVTFNLLSESEARRILSAQRQLDEFERNSGGHQQPGPMPRVIRAGAQPDGNRGVVEEYLANGYVAHGTYHPFGMLVPQYPRRPGETWMGRPIPLAWATSRSDRVFYFALCERPTVEGGSCTHYSPDRSEMIVSYSLPAGTHAVLAAPENRGYVLLFREELWRKATAQQVYVIDRPLVPEVIVEITPGAWSGPSLTDLPVKPAVKRDHQHFGYEFDDEVHEFDDSAGVKHALYTPTSTRAPRLAPCAHGMHVRIPVDPDWTPDVEWQQDALVHLGDQSKTEKRLWLPGTPPPAWPANQADSRGPASDTSGRSAPKSAKAGAEHDSEHRPNSGAPQHGTTPAIETEHTAHTAEAQQKPRRTPLIGQGNANTPWDGGDVQLGGTRKQVAELGVFQHDGGGASRNRYHVAEADSPAEVLPDPSTQVPYQPLTGRDGFFFGPEGLYVPDPMGAIFALDARPGKWRAAEIGSAAHVELCRTYEPGEGPAGIGVWGFHHKGRRKGRPKWVHVGSVVHEAAHQNPTFAAQVKFELVAAGVDLRTIDFQYTKQGKLWLPKSRDVPDVDSVIEDGGHAVADLLRGAAADFSVIVTGVRPVDGGLVIDFTVNPVLGEPGSGQLVLSRVRGIRTAWYTGIVTGPDIERVSAAFTEFDRSTVRPWLARSGYRLIESPEGDSASTTDPGHRTVAGTSSSQQHSPAHSTGNPGASTAVGGQRSDADDAYAVWLQELSEQGVDIEQTMSDLTTIWDFLGNDPKWAFDAGRNYGAVVLFGSPDGGGSAVLTNFVREQGLSELPVVFSGYDKEAAAADEPQRPWATEAARFGLAAEQLGLNSDRIIKEPDARNTRQNAAHSVALLKEHGHDVESIVVVCNPQHARRVWATIKKQSPVVQHIAIVGAQISVDNYIRYGLRSDTHPDTTPHEVVTEILAQVKGLLESPSKGHIVEQEIPLDILAAYRNLTETLGIPAAGNLAEYAVRQQVKQYVAQGHPEQAVRLIQEEYGARVFRWVSANIGEGHAARDITNEACTNAVTRIAQIGNLGVEKWVVHNARNLMAEHRRFVQFRQRILDIFVAAADVVADGPASRALAVAGRSRMQACIRAALTPDQQRKIIQLWQTQPDASTEQLTPADVRAADPALWGAVRRLAVAITAAHTGTDLADARAAAFVEPPAHESPEDDAELALSEQELEILQLVTRGLFPHEIGKVLRVSQATVEEALAHVSDELGVDGLTAMLDAARRAHLIDDEHFTPTDQQIRLLDLVAGGKTNKEIGEILGLTTGTVNVYLSRLEAEFGTGTRAGLTAMAIRMGFIEHRGAATADGVRVGDLAPAELDLLAMTAKGMSNRAIAEILGVHEVSVGRYYRRIKDKLGTESRAAMVAIVMPQLGAGTGLADSELSDLEKQILRLVVDGVPNAGIGTMLGMPESAVPGHRARIAVKLDLRNLNAMIESGRHPELNPSPAEATTPDSESARTETARERIGLPADADPMPSAADRNADVEQNLAFLARHHDHFPVKYTTDPGLVYIPDPGHPPTEILTTGITPRGQGPLTTYRDIDQARRWSTTGRVYVARPEAGFLRADPDRSVQLIGGITGSRILGYYHFGPEVPGTLPYGFTIPAQQAGDWIPNTVHGDPAPPPLSDHNSADSPIDATEPTPASSPTIDDNQLASEIDLDGPLYVAAAPVDIDEPLYIADPDESAKSKIGDEQATVENRHRSDSEDEDADDLDASNFVVGLAHVVARYPILRDVLHSAQDYQSLGSDEGEVMPTDVALALRDAAVKFGRKVSLGNYNDIYLLGEFAIRIPRADGPDQLDFVLWPKEYRTLQAITQHAPRIRQMIPQVLHVELDAQDNLLFEIQRRIDGEPVRDIREPEVMNAIYSVAEQLENVPVPQDLLPLPEGYPESGDSVGFFQMLLDHIERMYQRYRAIPKYRAMFDELDFPESLTVGLARELEYIRSQPFRILHGDITKENVLQTDIGVMIVDFGLAMFGPADYEAAVMRHRSPGTVHGFDDLPSHLLPYVQLLDQARVMHDTIRLVDEASAPQPDSDKTFNLAWNVSQALGLAHQLWPRPRLAVSGFSYILDAAFARVRESDAEREEPLYVVEEPLYVVAEADRPATTMDVDNTPGGPATEEAPGPTQHPNALIESGPRTVSGNAPEYVRKCLVQTVRASWAVGYDQATIPHEDADTWKD